MVRYSSSSHEIEYFAQVKDLHNPKVHYNCSTGSKVTVVLMNWWIMPVCAVASGGICAAGLFFRQVIEKLAIAWTKKCV